MSWEQRNGSGKYYTRSRRVNGKIVRQYIGTGDLAELAAMLDAEERAERQAEAETRADERLQLHELEGFCSEVDNLASVYLLMSGCYKHKGEWRRAHG
jgi:hypothetical protein